MSLSTFESPSQASEETRKRRRSTIWDNFIEEADSHANKTMKCKECGQQLSAYKNVLDRHWQQVHKDKEQTPKKILGRVDPATKEPSNKYRKIQTALADVLSTPSVPINLFLNPVMRKFVHELNPSFELPSSFATLKRIPSGQYEAIKALVKSRIREMPQRASMTTDIWMYAGMKHSYLGYTLYYCDRNGTLQRIFLGLSEIRGSHTGSLIRRETEKMLSEYGLSVDKLFKVVTDGASNMGKAFKDVFEVDVNLQFLDEDEDCEFVDGIDDENTTENITEVDVIICSAFPLRVKCVAHSLQLAIVDEFRMCVLPSSAYSKMMDVVRAFRKSPLAIQELDEATGKALLSVSNTRWSYQILGIQRYLELEEDVRAIAKSRNMNPPTSIEVEFLRQVHSLMKIFVDVLRRVQTEKSVSISLCYGYLKIIYDSLVRFKIRFEQPEVMEEPASVVCLDATLDRLMEEYARKQASQRKQKEPNRGKSWVVQILQRVIEMNPFGKEKIDSLKYWTSLIETGVQPVAKLALEVLSVSISSALVERIFSQAGLATARHRNRTKLDLLISQLFIHYNRNV